MTVTPPDIAAAIAELAATDRDELDAVFHRQLPAIAEAADALATRQDTERVRAR